MCKIEKKITYIYIYVCVCVLELGSSIWVLNETIEEELGGFWFGGDGFVGASKKATFDVVE